MLDFFERHWTGRRARRFFIAVMVINVVALAYLMVVLRE